MEAAINSVNSDHSNLLVNSGLVVKQEVWRSESSLAIETCSERLVESTLRTTYVHCLTTIVFLLLCCYPYYCISAKIFHLITLMKRKLRKQNNNKKNKNMRSI